MAEAQDTEQALSEEGWRIEALTEDVRKLLKVNNDLCNEIRHAQSIIERQRDALMSAEKLGQAVDQITDPDLGKLVHNRARAIMQVIEQWMTVWLPWLRYTPIGQAMMDDLLARLKEAWVEQGINEEASR